MIMTFVISLPLSAQKITYVKSSIVTKRNADKELREEGKKESIRKNRNEKRAEKTEKRLTTKAKYKHRKKVLKFGREKKHERHEKRVKNADRSSSGN